MRPANIITVLALFIFLFSCSSEDPVQKGASALDMSEVMEWITTLSSDKYEGRETGTAGGIAAAAYLDSVIIQMGYNPVRENFHCEIAGKDVSNIHVKIEGADTNNIIIVGAHYDGLGIREGEIYNGADDNMSGVSAVLSLAKMQSARGVKPSATIIFTLWDCEERKITGSRYFVSNFYKPQRISLYMNFDMVGRTRQGDEFPEVCFAWNNNFPQLRTICEQSYLLAAKNDDKWLDIVYEERTGDGKGGSDYAPFSALNTPFIAWMETELHSDYHKPTDTADKISPLKLKRVILLSYYILTNFI